MPDSSTSFAPLKRLWESNQSLATGQTASGELEACAIGSGPFEAGAVCRKERYLWPKKLLITVNTATTAPAM
jgi:hypothetical protein